MGLFEAIRTLVSGEMPRATGQTLDDAKRQLQRMHLRIEGERVDIALFGPPGAGKSSLITECYETA